MELRRSESVLESQHALLQNFNAVKWDFRRSMIISAISSPLFPLSLSSNLPLYALFLHLVLIFLFSIPNLTQIFIHIPKNSDQPNFLFMALNLFVILPLSPI